VRARCQVLSTSHRVDRSRIPWHGKAPSDGQVDPAQDVAVAPPPFHPLAVIAADRRHFIRHRWSRQTPSNCPGPWRHTLVCVLGVSQTDLAMCGGITLSDRSIPLTGAPTGVGRTVAHRLRLQASRGRRSQLQCDRGRTRYQFQDAVSIVPQICRAKIKAS